MLSRRRVRSTCVFPNASRVPVTAATCSRSRVSVATELGSHLTTSQYSHLFATQVSHPLCLRATDPLRSLRSVFSQPPKSFVRYTTLRSPCSCAVLSYSVLFDALCSLCSKYPALRVCFFSSQSPFPTSSTKMHEEARAALAGPSASTCTRLAPPAAASALLTCAVALTLFGFCHTVTSVPELTHNPQTIDDRRCRR